MAEATVMNNFALEDIVKAVMTILTQGTTPTSEPDAPEGFVPKNTVKRFKSIDDYPDLMKVKDVQEYLRIGENATYEFLNHPKCPTSRFGSSIRIRKDRLLEYLDEWEKREVTAV